MQKNPPLAIWTLLIHSLILGSCYQSPTTANTILPSTNDRVTIDTPSVTKAAFDTVVHIEGKPYHIQCWQHTSGDFDDATHNTLLMVQKDGRKVFSDSFAVARMGNPIEITDLNHDGYPDVAIYKESGGRGANEYWYWLLYNNKTHSFSSIQDIDQHPTVNMDSTGLVVSHAFYGENMNQSYFYIDKDFKLKDLEVEVETLAFDDTTHLAAIAFNKALQKYRERKDK